MLLDYLSMHGETIVKESYIEHPFSIPTTIEEVAMILPGNTQFEDIDDLLVTLGKQHDRTMLHSFVSKLFKVNKRLLQDAENNRMPFRTQNVLEIVNSRRQDAKNVGAAISPAPSEEVLDEPTNGESGWPKPSSPMIPIEKVVKTVVDGSYEYADPEHCCEVCLPVYGDKIVGTRPENDPDSTPKVHRLGCPHAQRAINRALHENKHPADMFNNFELRQEVDSESLRRSNSWGAESIEVAEIPVKLQWADFQAFGDQHFAFPCELVIHAVDRKLLLADCSEVVSELSEIVRTGSQTTNEHATLVFLINVRGIADLQKLMDSLRQIRSVMAVERRVSKIEHAKLPLKWNN